MSVAASGAGGRSARHVLMLFSECLERLHYTRVNVPNRRNIFGESEPSLVVVVGRCAFYTGTLFVDLWPCLAGGGACRGHPPTHERGSFRSSFLHASHTQVCATHCFFFFHGRAQLVHFWTLDSGFACGTKMASSMSPSVFFE